MRLWLLPLGILGAVHDCGDDHMLLQPQRPRRYGSEGRFKRRIGRPEKNFNLPFGYTILGPGHQVVARLLLPVLVPCPSHLHLGPVERLVPVTVRAEPHVGLHGAWFTDGQRTRYLPGINYTAANPFSPFSFEDRVCEAFFMPGSEVEAFFYLQDGRRVQVPLPPRQPERFLLIGDTGLRIEAKNDGWCAEKLQSPRTLYGAKTCASESLLDSYNASLVDGMFQKPSSRADPAENGWPFKRVCEEALKSSQDGDVVVHTGDYLYSHGACPFPFPDQPPSGEERVFGDCTGVANAWGDTSVGWIREFFFPAEELLQQLPWIVLRGNHETCERSGHGWFRYLDPRPSATFPGGDDVYLPYCVSYTAPYHVQFDHDNWLVLDSSEVENEDVSIDSYPPLEYTTADAEAAGAEPVLSMDSCNTKATSGDDHVSGFLKLAELSRPEATRQWLASHRPLFGLTFQDEGGGGQLYSYQCQLTDAMAKANVTLPNIAAIVSGHFHSWQLVEFQAQRPAQLVVGNSGTQLATPRDGSPNGLFRAAGRPLLGAEISYSETVGEFGWTQLSLSGSTESTSMSAFFLGDERFQSHPEIHRTLVPRSLRVDQTWYS